MWTVNAAHFKSFFWKTGPFFVISIVTVLEHGDILSSSDSH